MGEGEECILWETELERSIFNWSRDIDRWSRTIVQLGYYVSPGKET